MIHARKYFEELTKRLTLLKDDFVAHDSDPRNITDWNAQIEARHSLPEGDKVTVSYLACRFLEDYGFWINLRHRIRKFCGEEASGAEGHASLQFRVLATQLRETESFRPVIEEYFADLLRRFQRLNENARAGVAEVVQQVMMVDRLCAIPSGSNTQSYVDGLKRSGRYAMAREQLATAWSNRDDRLKASVDRRLVAYRKNLLMAKSLEPEDALDSPFYLPLETMTGESFARHMNNPFPDDEIGSGLWENQLRPLISALADYLESWGGYQEAFDILTDDEIGGPKDGFGDPITVIPSRRSEGVCNPVCLVFAKIGGKRSAATQFDKLMKTLWAHLTRCPITKSIVIVTDWWDSRSFAEDHLENFRAFHDAGRRFVFLSVGVPDTQLSPIAVDLS